MRLLSAYLQTLNAEKAIDTPEAQHLAAVHVHDLAALALGATRDAAAAATGSVRAARLAAIKQDVLSNLADPGLSIAAVASRHALSARYVHRLFESEGVSYTEYVVRQRLQRARRMLLDPRLADVPIGTIAFNVGFGDLSYFNRAFRRQFSGTPSEVRRQGH